MAERGGPHGPRPPTFISGGPGPPLFCLSSVSLSNTISIGSSDKVNRLMKIARNNRAFSCAIKNIVFGKVLLSVNLSKPLVPTKRARATSQVAA